jgi:membrane-associated protein
MLSQILDIVLHLDRHLAQITSDYGAWTYLIVCLVVFCETGLVVTPFLPGDSLLFAIGAVAALGSLDLRLLALFLMLATFAGDNVNYFIGRKLGPKIMSRPDSRWLRKEHLDRTHAFFEKYGGKTIIIARFVPIVRTFTPFVAGVGAMTYRRFVAYSVVGAALWVIGFLLAGYFFGNFPFVKKNFTLVILAIIVISLLPGVIEFFRARRQNRRDSSESSSV